MQYLQFWPRLDPAIEAARKNAADINGHRGTEVGQFPVLRITSTIRDDRWKEYDFDYLGGDEPRMDN